MTQDEYIKLTEALYRMQGDILESIEEYKKVVMSTLLENDKENGSN